MSKKAYELFTDLDHWQGILDRRQDIFSGILDESRIGIMPKAAVASQEGKVLVWEAEAGRMAAKCKPFTGFRNADVDILFVAEEEVLDNLYNDGEINRIKEQIRLGAVLFYSLKTKNDLLDLGYEGFLDTLGLAFMGACR